MTGGALGWLNLSVSAYDQVPLKRIEHILREHWSGRAESIPTMLGSVIINSDLWDQGDTVNLIRASCDAEQGPQTVAQPLRLSTAASSTSCV